jgi:hypothetical protein
MMADAGTVPEEGPATTSRRFTHGEYIRMRETGILTAEESVELIHGRTADPVQYAHASSRSYSTLMHRLRT